MTSTAVGRPLRMGMGALEDPEALGRVLASSGFFSDTRDAAQAVVKVLAGQELGFGPIASMTGIYIVKGRVTISANLLAAAVKRHPRYDFRVRTLSNDVCDVVFLDTAGTCSTCGGAGHVEGERGQPKVCRECVGTGLFTLGASEFTKADANKAGLSGDNWTKYPRNMLFARAMSNGAKFFVPDVFAGAPIYTPDELGADIDPETGELLNYTPAPAVVESPPAKVWNEAEAHEAAAQAAGVPEPTKTPPPEPSPKPKPKPVAPVEEPEPEPEPVAEEATSAHTFEPVGDTDPDAKLTDEEAEQTVAYLHRMGTPETMWRMALMTWDAEKVADLTRGQARELMRRARQRYGATETA